MKQLLVIKEQDINPQSPVVDTSNFRKREAARAVLLDSNGGVFLLKVGKHNYHKLPGGGVDDGEDLKTALTRELLEEVSCTGEVIAELGTVVEYRNYDDGGLEQTSYCYLANQVGDQGEPDFTDDEIAGGMHEVKAGSIDEAISLLENDVPNNLEGHFIQMRDLAFLKAAKELAK